MDLFTLNCVTIVNMFLSSCALLFVYRLNRWNRGIRDSALAGFVITFGFGLAPLRLLFPGKTVNLISNVLIFGGTLLLLLGVRRFRELKPVSPSLRLAIVGAYAGLFIVWLYLDDSLRARTTLASLGLACLIGCAARAIGARVPPRDRSVYWTTAGFYAAQALTLALRGALAWRVMPQTSLFSKSGIDLLNVVSANLAVMGGAFGLCMATNLKLIRDTEKLAFYDPLTSLPNRRHFETCLAQSEERIRTRGGTLALIYCDLDDFKNVNDELGHDAGDQVLRIVARRLREVLPRSECLARVGGDEFVALIENAPARPELLKLMSAVQIFVEKEIEIRNRSVSPKISYGLAVFPEDTRSTADLVRLADASMYAMKRELTPRPA